MTKLHGKGIEGIKRNMFAENMVRSVTAEAHRLIEGLKGNDLCFKHLEREDLVRLSSGLSNNAIYLITKTAHTHTQ